MTAPVRHISSGPLVTLEDIERAVNRCWEWLAVPYLRVRAWLGDNPAAVWEELADPRGEYGEEASPELLAALRRLHQIERDVAAAGSGSFPVVVLESSLLRPGIAGADEAVAARRTTVDLTKPEAPKVGLESIVPLIPTAGSVRPLVDAALAPARRESDTRPTAPAALGWFQGVPSC